MRAYVSAYSTSDCIYSCDGQDDGEYQACEGCQHYYSCSGGSGQIQDCGWDSEWDDNQKSCVDKGDSSSCCGKWNTNCYQFMQCSGLSCKGRRYHLSRGNLTRIVCFCGVCIDFKLPLFSSLQLQMTNNRHLDYMYN